jgi:hypothetical protein
MRKMRMKRNSINRDHKRDTMTIMRKMAKEGIEEAVDEEEAEEIEEEDEEREVEEAEVVSKNENDLIQKEIS